MREGGRDTQLPGIAKQYVETAPALGNGFAKPVNRIKIFQIQRHKRCVAARCIHLIIQFFQPTHCARDRNNVGTSSGEPQRSLIADAA